MSPYDITRPKGVNDLARSIHLETLVLQCNDLNSFMMTSSNRSIYPLCREFTGHQLSSLTKASDAELWCFLWWAPEQMVDKQLRCWWFEMPLCSFWCHGNVDCCIPVSDDKILPTDWFFVDFQNQIGDISHRFLYHWSQDRRTKGHTTWWRILLNWLALYI